MTMVCDCGWWTECITTVCNCGLWRECIKMMCDCGGNVSQWCVIVDGEGNV